MKKKRVLQTKLLIGLLLVQFVSNPLLAALPEPNRSSPATFPAASESDCKKLCDWKNLLKDAHVVIDANTGQILDGSTRFPKEGAVQIVLVNLNPFKFKYRFRIVSQSLETAIAASFLNLFLGDLPQFKKLVSNPSEFGLLPAPPPPSSCPGLSNTESYSMKSQVTEGKLKDDTDKLTAAKKAYDRFVKNTEPDSLPDCEQACQAAQSLQTEIGTLDLDTLGKSADERQKEVDQLTKDVATLKAQASTSPLPADWSTNCSRADVETTLRRVTVLEATLAKLKQGIADLKKFYGSLNSAATLIEDAFKTTNLSGSPFFEIRYPQLAGGPTEHQVTICRTNLREEKAKEVCLDTIKIQVGESSLALSAGIGFSTIPDRRIIRTTGLVDDGKGGKKTASVFGYENNSNFKPSGVFMLNAGLWHWGGKAKSAYSFGPSSGVVISSRNNTTEFEFIAGGSVGILRNNVFLSIGFHAARIERLAGGFEPGKEIPADLKDPLPVEKNWHPGAMFAITYKLK